MSTMLCDLKIPRCRVSFHRLPSKQQKGTISINTTAPNKTNNARFQGTPTCSLHNPFPARSGEKTLVHKNHKNQSVLGDPLETNIRFNRYPASANANDNCPPQPRLEELPRLVHAHMGATESVWTRHGGCSVSAFHHLGASVPTESEPEYDARTSWFPGIDWP